MYTDWAGNEFWAIINLKGEVVRDAIRSIEFVLNNHKLFIVEMSGLGMGGDALQYDLADDDWKMSVIDRHGQFIIPPIYRAIYFDEIENLFIAKNYGYSIVRLGLDGAAIR